MRTRGTVALVVLAAALAVVLASSPGRAASEEFMRVFVTNWPETQKVRGIVEIEKPVRVVQTATAVQNDVVVAPVSPKDTVRWVSGGTIETSGYRNITLSLSGQVNGTSLKAGQVGAILVPDETAITRAFDEKGIVQFPMEVSAGGVTSSVTYFASNQPTHTVAFQRYRVYYYNTCERSVTVNLFAYLTN